MQDGDAEGTGGGAEAGRVAAVDRTRMRGLRGRWARVRTLSVYRDATGSEALQRRSRSTWRRLTIRQ